MKPKKRSGDFILNGNNVVSELAATLVDNLQFTNTIDLLIVKATYTSICDPLLTEDFMGLDIGERLGHSRSTVATWIKRMHRSS